MNDIEYKIIRYELFPKELPTFIVVGISITDLTTNNVSCIEHLVPISETLGKTHNEVCQIAYDNSKPQVAKILENFSAQRTSIVGYTFVPND